MQSVVRKIALISHGLGGGGAERAAATLSLMFDQAGFEVHNVIITDRVDYPFAGKLLNLGHLAKSSFAKKAAKSLMLYGYLRENDIRTIIDMRSRNRYFRELVYRWIYGDRQKIFVVHSHHLLNYFPESRSKARKLYADSAIVCVSKAIEEKVRTEYVLGDVSTIHNPVVISDIPPTGNLPEKFILFFGRINNEIKNFTLMLDAFRRSGIYSRGYKLMIMGEGPDENLLASMIAQMELSAHVILRPFEKNPLGVVQKARYTVLTSHYEGFPMSLIESLAVGTPVVAVDCESGPAEIVKNRQNGLLVNNHDAVALAEAMILFASDDELYQICTQNAVESVSHLSVENILKQWKQILH